MPALGTDYQNAKPMDDFTPIPVGDYKAVITESEIKQTTAGDGQYLNLKIEVIEGEFAGRVLFTILNLWNPNPKAVEIANRELATIVAAVGKTGASQSEELHNIPMTIRVGVEMGNAYVKNGVEHPAKAQNRIKNYLPYATPSAPSAPVTIQTKPAPQQAPTGPGTPTPSGQPPINPATGKPYKPWENWPGKGQA